jgi:hypothetical protein
MNDLKLLISNERKLVDLLPNSNLELITFDTLNMNSIYVTDHNRIYSLDEDLNVTKRRRKFLFQTFRF